MTALVLITTVPIITGIFGYLIYKLRNEFAFLGAVLNLYYGFFLFITTRKPNIISKNIFSFHNLDFSFYLDPLAGVLIMIMAIVFFLLLVYSFRSVRGIKNTGTYYLLLSISIALTNMLILANNLLFFSILSFFLCLVFYRLLMAVTEKDYTQIRQSVLSLFVYNLFILAGILLLYLYGFNIALFSEMRIAPVQPCVHIGLILMIVGLAGKLGLAPLHTWSDKIAQNAPVTVYALIPNLIEKVISIYLLIRVVYYIFDTASMPYLRFLIIFIAALNIIWAGIEAIRSKSVYKFLNRNAIVQTGFILLGIAGFNPIALAGGLFHLLNYLIFQPALLFTAGSFEYWTKSALLDSFTGMAGKMPITYFILLLVILASIGIPPLSGFFSKLIVLGGISLGGITTNFAQIITVIAFSFGTVISVIYFAKFIRNFIGQHTKYSEKIREPGFTMWLPSAIFSLLCFLLGIFVYTLSWRTIIVPVVQNPKIFSYEMLSIFTRIRPLQINSNMFILIILLIIGFILSYLKPFAKLTRSV